MCWQSSACKADIHRIMNLRYSTLPPLSDESGSPILKIIFKIKIKSIPSACLQISVPLLKPSSYHIILPSELLRPPETRLISPTPQFHNIDLRLDKNERCDRLSLCHPISLLRPWTDLMRISRLSLGTTLLSRGLRNERSYYPLNIFTSADNFPWPFSARSTGQKEVVRHLWQNYPTLLLEGH